MDLRVVARRTQERTALTTLPIETGASEAPPAQAATPSSTPVVDAARTMAAELQARVGGTDAVAARAAADALRMLADAYNEQTAAALSPAISHWLRLGNDLLRRGTSSVSTPPATAPGPTTATPRASTYDDLPAHMKGGVSSGNGMPIIILSDPSEIALLPLWTSMHPDAAAFYRDLLAQGLAGPQGQVMGLAGFEIHVKGTEDVVATTPVAPTSTATADEAALARLRDASFNLRGVDLVDYNRDWARQMVESGTASNPAFYQLLETATAAIKDAYRKHLGREPTKDELGSWLPFTPSMEANERQWTSNLERLQDRANLEQVAALIAARTSTPTTPVPTPTPTVSDAQIADFIRANLSDPNAIATAMVQYGVSMSRLQAAIGASWDEVKAYVGSSNNDTLKRLLAEDASAA